MRARIIGILFIAGSLSGCDYVTDIEVLSSGTVRMTATQFAEPGEFYEYRLFYGPSPLEPHRVGQFRFCEETNWTAIGHVDGRVECSRSTEGNFTDVKESFFWVPSRAHYDEHPPFTVVAPGVVRVQFDPHMLWEGNCLMDLAERRRVGGLDSPPEEHAKVREQFGHNRFIVHISGGEIVESNLPVSPDGRSVTFDYAALDVLLCVDESIPHSVYADVRVDDQNGK